MLSPRRANSKGDMGGAHVETALRHLRTAECKVLSLVRGRLQLSIILIEAKVPAKGVQLGARW